MERDLAILEQRIHRHHDGAQPQRPVEQDREVRDVRQHQPDPVAGADAFRRQQPGHVARRALERRVRQLQVVELERRAVAVLGGGVGEHVREVGHLAASRALSGRSTIADSVTLATVERPDYYGNPAGLTDEIDVVRAIYAAFAARDLERALAFVAPDCEIHLEGTARRVGRELPYRGHDGMRQYFADVERYWDELVLHAEDFRVIPGSVIVMGHVTGVARGEAIRRSAVWTWRVRDGRAVHVRVADMGAA